MIIEKRKDIMKKLSANDKSLLLTNDVLALNKEIFYCRHCAKEGVEIGAINLADLYDILVDEDKLKRLVSKLKNKAFW